MVIGCREMKLVTRSFLPACSLSEYHMLLSRLLEKKRPQQSYTTVNSMSYNNN